MPKAYEEMKKRFKSEGLGDKAAKEKAVKIYNSKNPKRPVTRKKHG